MPAVSDAGRSPHLQGMGSAKDTQTMLRHTKPDTAQINYVQPVEDSVRSAVDKLAGTLLGWQAHYMFSDSEMRSSPAVPAGPA